MNDNLKNQLLAFVLFHIKNKVVEDKRMYLNDETLTDSDGFDYESVIDDSENINFIKLNDLNNNYKTSKKTSSSENAYLKIDNKEYDKISLQIDYIDKANTETSNKIKYSDYNSVKSDNLSVQSDYNSAQSDYNSVKSDDIDFNDIFQKNDKIDRIIEKYTETQKNTETKNSEYIDIIDSNRLWDMIEKNNKMIYTDNYDELSLESESLNNIVKNSASSKSVFLTESDNHNNFYDQTHSNLMDDIMNTESSSSSEYNMVDSYNFNNSKNKKQKPIQKYNNSTNSYESSDDLLDSYNDIHIKKKTNKKQNNYKNKTSESNSDNTSIIDTYCMSNVNNKNTTSTIEECKKTDDYNSNIFEKYLFNSTNFNKKTIKNNNRDKFVVKRKEKSKYEKLKENIYSKEDLDEQKYSEEETICTETFTRLNNSRLLLFRRR